MFIPYDPNANKPIYDFGPPDPRYRATWQCCTAPEDECMKSLRSLPVTDEIVDEETWNRIAAIIKLGPPEWVMDILRRRSAMRPEDV